MDRAIVIKIWIRITQLKPRPTGHKVWIRKKGSWGKKLTKYSSNFELAKLLCFCFRESIKDSGVRCGVLLRDAKFDSVVMESLLSVSRVGSGVRKGRGVFIFIHSGTSKRGIRLACSLLIVGEMGDVIYIKRSCSLLVSRPKVKNSHDFNSTANFLSNSIKHQASQLDKSLRPKWGRRRGWSINLMLRLDVS